VGAGHRPYPHSDVLVDKYLADDQREGRLRPGNRPLIVCGIENLPFADRAFAYAIAAHVVEHVADPGAALSELARVAPAGYIETPSALMEMIEPHRDYHLWSVLRRGRELVFLPKDPATRSLHQQMTHRLIAANCGWRLFAASNPDLLKTRFDWSERIPFRIEQRAFHPDEYLPFVDQGAGRCVAGLGRKVLAMLARRLPRGCFARPRVALAALLRCPRCHGPVELETTRVRCRRCRGGYPRAGAYYFLSPERFEAQ